MKSYKTLNQEQLLSKPNEKKRIAHDKLYIGLFTNFPIFCVIFYTKSARKFN